MSEWITYQQAATILGCHISYVPKLIRMGKLTSRRTARRYPSLSRAQVEELAHARRVQREERAARPAKRRRLPRDPRPDRDHEWLTPRQVAALLGVTPKAVRKRIGRGTLPAVTHEGRYWVRADHLELVERARLARRMRYA